MLPTFELRSPLSCSTILCLTLLLTLGAVSGFSSEIRVADSEAARKAVNDAKPGDLIILAAGEWRDVDLRFYGSGSAEHPIRIQAEEAGKTILTGSSRIRIGGEYLVISGLWLRNPTVEKADPVEFRIDSKTRASHCRLTQCAITEDVNFSANHKSNHWVGIFGEDNQVDHCNFSGKKNVGTTLVVWLGEGNVGHHRILANHFANRPPLGQNGGETIRIGDSTTSMLSAHCLIEGNKFVRCDGEVEIISNKSCHNIYRSNWFIESQGTLTLRHGNDCLVEGNYFIGKKRSSTGGVRVIGERHRVIGNVFSELEGDGYRAAICLASGIPNSPLYGYFQVINAEIRENTILDCKVPIVIGLEGKDAVLPPKDSSFEKNSVVAREGRPAVQMKASKPPVGIQWKSNSITGRIEGLAEVEGMRSGTPNFLAIPNEPSCGSDWYQPEGDTER